MKINRQFIKDRGEDWERIRASHRAFNIDRWRWREIVRRTRVSAAAKDVALSLCDKFGGGEDGRIYPSHAALAADTGLDERTVRAAVSKLHDAGLIVTMSRGSTSTLYFFADPTVTFVTVESGLGQNDNRHKRDGLTVTNVTVLPADSCRSDRHKRVGNHDQLTCTDNMSVEHEAETSVIDIQPAAGTSCNSCLSDTHISTVDVVAHTRSDDEIDQILEEAVRDAEDTDLLTLLHPELRNAFLRRYGNAIDQKWWLLDEWMNDNLDWIEVISELEKVESDGEEDEESAAV